MSEWRNDSELFTLMREILYTPVVGDILDQLGCYHQFLPQPIQPIRESDILAGRAMPALVADAVTPDSDRQHIVHPAPVFELVFILPVEKRFGFRPGETQYHQLRRVDAGQQLFFHILFHLLFLVLEKGIDQPSRQQQGDQQDRYGEDSTQGLAI